MLRLLDGSCRERSLSIGNNGMVRLKGHAPVRFTKD